MCPRVQGGFQSGFAAEMDDVQTPLHRPQWWAARSNGVGFSPSDRLRA